MLVINLYYIEMRNNMKKLTEAYTYGKVTAKAEAILEKYGAKSSVTLEKFTDNLCSQLVPLVIKAIDCAKVNNDEEAFCEIILCFQALNRRTPFKKRLTNEEKSVFVKGYIDAKQISNP